MYFTDDKKLQRFEREMKIVPNFERKEVWEFAESCRDCKNYKCKLESCMEAHCPYLKRKIRSNSIITRDLVEAFLVDNPYISLKEISFRRNISDKEFYYICNAILIRRFGLAVIKKGV